MSASGRELLQQQEDIVSQTLLPGIGHDFDAIVDQSTSWMIVIAAIGGQIDALTYLEGTKQAHLAPNLTVQAAITALLPLLPGTQIQIQNTTNVVGFVRLSALSAAGCNVSYSMRGIRP